MKFILIVWLSYSSIFHKQGYATLDTQVFDSRQQCEQAASHIKNTIAVPSRGTDHYRVTCKPIKDYKE